MNRSFFFLQTLLLLLFVSSSWAQLKVPPLAGLRVHDEAHVLSLETIDRLETTLRQFEDSTSNQIAILIIPSLEGEILESYGVRVAHDEWKLGQKDKDNGVLLLIAVNDRKMRIEVGQGLEGVLTDALSNRIIRNEMAPNFRKGDYDAGVLAAINAIEMAIKGEYKSDGPDISRSGGKGGGLLVGLVTLVLLSTFTYTALFTKGCAGWGLYGFLTPFYAIFPGIALGSASTGWVIFLIYLIGFPILKLILGRTAWGQQIAKNMEESAARNKTRGGGWSSGGGWFIGGGGGSWGGGGGGGGFSGGGGSFGGGGSSGSW